MKTTPNKKKRKENKIHTNELQNSVLILLNCEAGLVPEEPFDVKLQKLGRSHRFHIHGVLVQRTAVKIERKTQF